ncbi:nuclear transport factor 2 family protein [Streptomyces sp. NPDC054841]
MTISVDRLSDPAVRAFVKAVNSGDREAFMAALTPDATMSDEGSDRDLDDWTDKEIFDSRGHMEVESESDEGRSLVARYRNETWGEMRTKWRFTIENGKIARFDTAQA